MKKIDYKWFALALLWVAFFLQQGTRQVYGPLLGSIQGAVGATDVQLGLVSTVFTLVYGITIPFAGFAADLFSRKWMVVIGVAIFSAGDPNVKMDIKNRMIIENTIDFLVKENSK